MAHNALLNNVDHQDLRVATTRSAAMGDGVMVAVAVPSEFRELQAHYPIVFQKSADGTGFSPVALLGFQEGENLFLGPEGWDAAYLPLSIERQPFLIGVQGQQLLVHLDLESPRIGAPDGEPVFLPHGGSTEFLERMTSVLLALHEGLQSTPAFIDALLTYDLLESFVFDIELADGSQNRLAGFYTVHEERLAALGAEALGQLHAAGYLLPIYMAVASLSNLRSLVERKNQSLAHGL